MLPARNTKGAFPSPCGEKVGINPSEAIEYVYDINAVSVPLRGKGRDQPEYSKGLPGHSKGFRPLAGKR